MGYWLKVNKKQAEGVVGAKGRRKARLAHYNAIRRAIVEVERHHKRKYMLPGGGAKNPKPPRDGFIMTRTGTLKKSFGRVLQPKTASGVGVSGKIFAAYGFDVRYGKHLEDGTQRIRARNTLGQTQDDLAPQLERILGLTLAKEGL